ncbi:MAG: NrdH-redoxin [Candidatus Omnitrophota bacterium]|jgi:glutaredoxin-like YruB-family protein|nr:MAG: NrdH-redoxin [Candidatus Omnitrophota bacterium]
MDQKVIVYSTPTCPWCIRIKQFLKDNNVAFENYDVSSDQAKAEEMIQKSGQMGVPVLDIAGQIIIGFDKERITKALGLASQ